MTDDKGLGIFAMEKIPKGKIVHIFYGYINEIQDKHTLQITSKLHLHVEGYGRYINHSCEPNCVVVNKFKLVAIKDIEADEEITFDYSTTEEHLNMKCSCGSKNCSKLIKGYSDKYERE